MSKRRPRRQRDGQIQQLPWRLPQNHYKPIEVLSADQVEAIHLASLQILSDIGIDVWSDEARDYYVKAGAEYDTAKERMRFDPALIEAQIAKAPSMFTLHARNPAHHLTVGGNYLNFGTVGSAPHASDLDNGRRTGNLKDYDNFVRLAQSLNIIHFISGYPVEPVDVPPNIRHLKALSSIVHLSDKAFHAYSLGRTRILDGIEIARIARGLSHDELINEPSLITVVNANSPLRLDGPMLTGIIEMARHGQVIILTPFTLSGAMAPSTLAGALAQQNAEALAGMVLAQIVRAGTPVVYGGFTSNVDMKSGAPAFGTPEYAKAVLAGGQLARRYGLPYRSSNVNAANGLDAQSGWESQISIDAVIMAHTNIVLHGAGWMEGGLCAGFEKMIIDADLLQMASEFLKPIEVNDDTLALSAIAEVGPGGHFFGTQHTLDRYETVFYSPILSDWRNFESWSEAGRPSAPEKANRVFKQLLAVYQPPPLDPAIGEALDAFVARRIEEGGADAD